jgi:hypothetical protein
MKKWVYILLFFPVTFWGQTKVFVTDIKSQADIIVFQENQPSQADLKVMFVPRRSDLNKEGLWYKVSYLSGADKVIYLTSIRSEADLNINIVGFRSYVGWINPDKKHLLD